MATYNHFYELPVYKVCRAFRKKIVVIAKKNLPKSEEFHLKGQLLDACRSITANLAEGFGRFHHKLEQGRGTDFRLCGKRNPGRVHHSPGSAGPAQ